MQRCVPVCTSATCMTVHRTNACHALLRRQPLTGDIDTGTRVQATLLLAALLLLCAGCATKALRMKLSHTLLPLRLLRPAVEEQGA